jgi:hypothetical protein
MSTSESARDIEKFFLVDDPSETGLARDLVMSGAVPEDLVPVDNLEEVDDEVCLLSLYDSDIILGTASAIHQRRH